MVMKESLTQYVEEQLGFYVYALRNPLDKKIFYVGKGVGSRVLAHANGVIDSDDSPETMKVQVIRSIVDAGLRVESFIVQHGLLDDDHAFQTESALYGLLTLLDESKDHDLFSLTNLIKPPTFEEFGLMSIDDVIAKYGVPADGTLIPHNSVFIKPAQLWRKGMSNDELWDSTRGWWPMSPRRISSIRYVFAVPNLVIRAVWEVKASDWRKQGPGDRGWEDVVEKRSQGGEKKPRFGFNSCVDVGATKFPDLINKSVAHTYLDGQGKRPSVTYLDDDRIIALACGSKPRKPFWNTELR
jgi:hypothetical protein